MHILDIHIFHCDTPAYPLVYTFWILEKQCTACNTYTTDYSCPFTIKCQPVRLCKEKTTFIPCTPHSGSTPHLYLNTYAIKTSKTMPWIEGDVILLNESASDQHFDVQVVIVNSDLQPDVQISDNQGIIETPRNDYVLVQRCYYWCNITKKILLWTIKHFVHACAWLNRQEPKLFALTNWR